jgi:hypothetical protein
VYTDMGIIKYKAGASLERVMLFYDMRKRAGAQVPVSKTIRIHVTRASPKGVLLFDGMRTMVGA